MILLGLPVKVTTKSKTYRLNLNWYRNCHHYILNNAKKRYTEIVMQSIGGKYDFEPLKAVSVTFMYTPSNNREFDLDNVDSVVRKFTLDALQKAGVIEDDGYKTVKALHSYVTDHDYEAEDHYVTIKIEEKL